jgi:hypothetical protein
MQLLFATTLALFSSAPVQPVTSRVVDVEIYEAAAKTPLRVILRMAVGTSGEFEVQLDDQTRHCTASVDDEPRVGKLHVRVACRNPRDKVVFSAHGFVQPKKGQRVIVSRTKNHDKTHTEVALTLL